jgi:hypothetical protein
MTQQNEKGETRFFNIWVTKNGLSNKKPEESDCFTQKEAELIADYFMIALGLKNEDTI